MSETSVAIGKCVGCHKDIHGFKDKASYLEYHLSNLCQECQDEVFGGAYTCEYCGKEVADKKDGYAVEHHFYCRPECYQHDVGF